MDTYETIFISASDLTQEKIEANVEKVKQLVTNAEGKILSLELWGRRKLAFPIKRYRDGFYVYLLHSSPRTIPAVLDRHFRLTETILRGLTVKVDPRHLEKVRSSVRSVTGETASTEKPMDHSSRREEGSTSQKKEDSALKHDSASGGSEKTAATEEVPG